MSNEIFIIFGWVSALTIIMVNIYSLMKFTSGLLTEVRSTRGFPIYVILILCMWITIFAALNFVMKVNPIL